MVKRVFKVFVSKSTSIKVSNQGKVVRFLGSDYPSFFSIKKVLKGVLGFRFFSLRLLCKHFNVSPNLSIGFFKDVQLVELKTVLFSGSFLFSYLSIIDKRKIFYFVGNFWEKMYFTTFSKIKEIGFKRFKRLQSGLPVRGQRTKTNAQTSRRSMARFKCLSIGKLFIIWG